MRRRAAEGSQKKRRCVRAVPTSSVASGDERERT